jgi:hypothetical protein
MGIPPFVARQRLGKHVPTVTNTHNNGRIVGRVSVGLSVYLPIDAREQLGKDFLAATKKCWRSFSMRSASYQRKAGDQFFP